MEWNLTKYIKQHKQIPRNDYQKRGRLYPKSQNIIERNERKLNK